MRDRQSFARCGKESDQMAGAEDSPAPPQAAREVAPKASGGGGGQTALRIGGWILAVVGGVLAVAGVALVIVHLTQRGKDRYYTSSTARVAAPGYAVTAEGLIGDLPSVASDVVGRVRVSARSSNGVRCGRAACPAPRAATCRTACEGALCRS
jgi:hypothetical protein